MKFVVNFELGAAIVYSSSILVTTERDDTLSKISEISND